jgi:hypothetical protein
MADQALKRSGTDISDTYVRELARVARGQRRDREEKTVEAREPAHPVEFDESGFPIPQRSGRALERLARRLSPF